MNEKKSVKALKTQLMGAVAMVIVAAIALSSSTYAWFAANTKVTATGMEVEANTESAYLLIDGDVDLTDATSTYTWDGEKPVALYPAAYYADKVTSAATAEDSTNWYMSTSNDPTKAVTGEPEITLTNFNNYVLVDTLFIGFKPDTATGDYDVTASATITDASDDGKESKEAVTVLLACGDKVIEANTTGAQIGTLAADGYLEVDVYIFYDGTHESVTTNNAKNLTGVKIDLAFDAVAVATP